MSLIVAPLEALTDSEISDSERRVLFALFSFRGRDTNTVFPSRESLAARCHIKDETRISKLTTSLADKGWLSKRKKSFRRGNEYRLTIPNRLLDSVSRGTDNIANVANSTTLVNSTPKKTANLADLATLDKPPNLAKNTTPKVANSATPKEQTIEQTTTPPPAVGDTFSQTERRFVNTTNWKPTDDLITQLQQLSVPREFILDTARLAEFRIYWRARPEPIGAWDAKYFSKVKNDWVKSQTAAERQQHSTTSVRKSINASLDDDDESWADDLEVVDG